MMETQLQSPAQGSPEWMAERLGKFTASNIYRLMGKPGNKTAQTYILERAAEVLTGRPMAEVFGPALDWGKENEPLAKHWYTRRTGNQVQEVGYVPLDEYAGGSPDGLIGKLGLIEIKCPFNTTNHIRFAMMKEQSDLLDIAPEYYYQIQMNLLCTGRKWAHFVSFDPRIDLECGLFIMEVQRDQQAIELMSERIKEATDELNRIISTLK